MKICGLMTENHIVIDLEPGSKEDVLRAFVQILEQRGLIDRPEQVLEELLKREYLGSTGLEKGIAIPHALTDGNDGPFVALSVVPKGMDFEALDRKPTYVLLMLLGSRDNPGIQLKILAHICRLVKETDLVERIKQTSSPGEICGIIKEAEGKIT